MHIPNVTAGVAAAASAFLAGLADAIRLGEEAFLDLLRSSAADVLNLVPSDKPYRTRLFNALCRKTPQRFCETVLLRNNPSGELEVYFTQRGPDDSAYPGQYHCPGSALQNGETLERETARRVANKEYQTSLISATALKIAEFSFAEVRGWGTSTPLVVELDGEPAAGKWFSVSDLSDNLVEHHRPVIAAAVAYRKNRQLYQAGELLMRLAVGLEPMDGNGHASDQDRAKLAVAEALNRVIPRTSMGTQMYDAFSPHATNITCEGVCFRRNPQNGITEVLLTTHPLYPGKLVGLGQIARPGEEYEATLERLRTKEFSVPTEFEYVGERHFPQDSRSDFLCRIYLALSEGEPRSGKWYPAEPLPENVLYSHREIIPVALEAFKKRGG